MEIVLVYDSTDTISASIEEVFKTIAEAVAIVVLVILLFLGSFRSVLMPVVTIPVSLIGVAAVLLAFGYSINLLTLLAMVLAIGLVVDDAIVVVENIHRHIEEGLTPLDAAILGMKEITGPIIAMTLTLAAVFSPLAFTGGLTGALFREFAVTLAGSVIISGIVALTITPMMAARVLKSGQPSRFQHFVDRSFDRLANWYERRVSSSLDFRAVTILVVLALAGATGFMFFKTTTELAPEEDQGALFAVLNGPRYATRDYTKLYTDQISVLTTASRRSPPSSRWWASAGSAIPGFYIWVIKDWADRERSQAELQQEIQGQLGKVAGVEGFVFAPPTLPGAGGGLPIIVVIQSIHDPQRVFEVAEQVRRRRRSPAASSWCRTRWRSTAAGDDHVDRDRAAALNVPISDVGRHPRPPGRRRLDRPVRPRFQQLRHHHRRCRRSCGPTPSRLGHFFVRAATGEMVPLSSVVSIATNASPAAIEQFNQLNSATISALPLPGVSTGDGLADDPGRDAGDPARGLLHRLFRPVAAGGDRGQHHHHRLRRRARRHLPGARRAVRELPRPVHHPDVGAAVDLRGDPAAQHRPRHPQHLHPGRADHADRADHQARHPARRVRQPAARAAPGMSKREAIVAAAKIRLRPILMTTAAMALAVVPLIIAEGAGAAARYSMGLVIFSGLLVGTMFTLFVVPMFYTLIAHPAARAEANAEPQPA